MWQPFTRIPYLKGIWAKAQNLKFPFILIWLFLNNMILQDHDRFYLKLLNKRKKICIQKYLGLHNCKIWVSSVCVFVCVPFYSCRSKWPKCEILWDFLKKSAKFEVLVPRAKNVCGSPTNESPTKMLSKSHKAVESSGHYAAVMWKIWDELLNPFLYVFFF